MVLSPPVPAATQMSTPSQPSPRPSQAMAVDPERALRLAPNFQPDVDLLTAEGLIAFGVKGSGKSNLLALLVEQLGRFLLPQIILDSEREYQSLLPLLPHGVLATASRCPGSADILRYGLQVVVDLSSWPTDEDAALAACHLLDELFTTTHALAPRDRVPCIIHLDEAGYWLPQEAVTYLSKQTRKQLADAFHMLATRGRKQGLTPFLYTQSISEVAKSAIRQAGIKVLMRQTLDLDLARYAQYLQGATAQTKRAIAAYPRGKAVVLLSDGSQHRVQFAARQSEHVSHAPQAQAALVKFAAQALDVKTVPMRDLTACVSAADASVQRRKPLLPVREQMEALLAQDPTVRPIDLAHAVGGSDSFASSVRRDFFAQHSEHVPVRHATMTQQLEALLCSDPALSVAELRRRVGCDQALVERVRRRYFEDHPELAPVRSASATERLSVLLAEDPTLSVTELCARVECGRTLAARVRQAYLVTHPEQAPPRRVTATERLYTLLAEDPTLSVTDLWTRVDCHAALASKVRRRYFEDHPAQAHRLVRQDCTPEAGKEGTRDGSPATR